MRKWKLFFVLQLLLFAGAALLIGASNTYAAESITLYTPYTNISVTPGESINYSIDVMNNTSEVQNVKLALEGLPSDWESEMTSGGWRIQQISVKPDESTQISLQVNIPLAVNKGDYMIKVIAEGITSLPLQINVSEQGTYKTELTTDQPNMEGHADSTFAYRLTLKNRTADKQLYALTSDAPRGWDVQFKVSGNSVTSVNVEANASQDINVEIHPPQQVAAGSFKIPIRAATNASAADTDLEAVITGTYSLELTTPSGLLSTDITAGKEKKLELQITNKGSADLTDISLTSSTPANWEVTFDEKEVQKLEAGKSKSIMATIKADDKAIAGDYALNISAQTPEATSAADFRIAVKTSMLWGWIGILLILLVIGGVYYLFRTYGRR